MQLLLVAAGMLNEKMLSPDLLGVVVRLAGHGATKSEGASSFTETGLGPPGIDKAP
jgi:hypothetical protein